MTEIVDAAASPGGLTAQSASRTVIAQALGRAVSLLAVVGSTAIVAREIGIDAYADWATVLSLVALVAFALDPGVSPIIVRRLTQDPGAAPTPQAVIPLRLVLGATAFALVVGVSTGLRGGSAALLAVALGAQVLPRALVLNATPWLQVDHRLHRQTALEAVTASLGLVLLAIAALSGADPWLLALVGFTGPTAVLALLMRRELAITPSRALAVPGPQRPRVVSMVREVAPLAVALLLVATYTRTFVVFLNAAEGADEVARYLFAFQFIEQLIVGAGIVAGAVLPLLAVRGRTTALLADELTHRLLCSIAAAGALVAAVIIALATPLTKVIGGPALAPAARYLELLAPMAAVILPAFILGYVYVTLGRGGAYLRFNVVALVLNVAANAALTLQIGALASARISWATEATVVAMAMLPVVRSGASGARAGALMLGIVSASVAAAELAGDHALPAIVPALALAALVIAVARHQLAWLLAAVDPRARSGARTTAVDDPRPPRPDPRFGRPHLPRPLGALLACALLLGVAWTVVTPAWQSPDENSHFAYVQYLGETGHLPGDAGRPIFSTEQVLAATDSNADHAAAQPNVKMAWNEQRFRTWEQRDARLGDGARSDGGGPNPASSNPPLYYLYAAPVYLAGKGLDIFGRLELLRLASVLWLLVTVAGAWLLAGEVFARDRVAQLCTAGAVALAPMVQFISASVSPDTMLFATWSLTLWLGVRLMRRGVTPAGAGALFAVAGAACVVKATSYAFLPGVALAFLVALARDGHLRRPRVAARPVLAAAAGIVLTFGAYVIWTKVTGRAVSTQVAQVSGTAHGTSVRELLSYVWQFYLPRVPGQIHFPTIAPHIPVYDIALKGVWGDFGWLEVLYSEPVYGVMAAITVVVGLLALAGLVRDRRRVDWWIVAFLALVVVGLFAGLHLTEYRQIKAGAVNFFQGRYLLPLAPLAGLALTRALQWLPRPRVAPAVAISLGALLVLDLFSLALVLTRFYA